MTKRETLAEWAKEDKAGEDENGNKSICTDKLNEVKRIEALEVTILICHSGVSRIISWDPLLSTANYACLEETGNVVYNDTFQYFSLS